MANQKLATASKQCRAYRKYLKEKGVPPHLATKGFLLTRPMIERLLTQNGKALDGIRVYVGLDDTGEMTIKPYAVGCVQQGDRYNDYKVPRTAQSAAVDPSVAATTTGTDAGTATLTATSLTPEDDETVLEEPRPCPSYCGDDNDLNTDPNP